MIKVLLLSLILIASTSWLYLLHRFAPSLGENGKTIDHISFPSSLEELKLVATVLQTYSVNHWWYVLLIFASAYIYKQAFCIPGSLFLNMLAGALYGNIGGFIFACLFTATGASICYILSKNFAKELVLSYFPQRLKEVENKVLTYEDHLFYFMLFLRLSSVTPGWLINITAPLIGIPIKTFYLTTLLGLGPYNFIGVSAGGMLSSIQSVNDIFSIRVLLNLIFMASLALGPAFFLKPRQDNKKITIS